MALLRVSLVAFCAATATVLATSPPVPPTTPIVPLDQGEFIGTTVGGVNKYLGIPYAQPPVGNLRFRRPQWPRPYVGEHNASAYGRSCSQLEPVLVPPAGLPAVTLKVLGSIGTSPTLPTGEDCLTINVFTPANATCESKYPVVVWFFGGAFEYGSSNNSIADGTVIVNRSIELQEPVIYVNFNYRLNAFGFLASQEVKDAGEANLGLHDQRLALQWVQKYIGNFGGDPGQVTAWGQSAGAISISLQMLAYDGKLDGLFHAAFIQSGAPTPVGDIVANGQPYYDSLVEHTNCSCSFDTLECLREVSYETLVDAINLTPTAFSYQTLSLAWQPYADGKFLKDDPQKLVQQGKVATIPLVSGAVEDEGALFSFSQINVTTDDDFRTYIQEYFIINATESQLDKALTLYPADPIQGSPYGTGTQDAWTPESKRIASILGDVTFQSPRRSFLGSVSGKQKTWSYLSTGLGLPYLGTPHGSDIQMIYTGKGLTDYLIHFVANLNPNGDSLPNWPEYTPSSPQMLTFYGGIPTNITQDTYRAEAISYLEEISRSNPL